ncbi:metallophosphoesterase, partial [Nostoc sp. NIES-2111]
MNNSEAVGKLTAAVGDIHGRLDLLGPLLDDLQQRWGDRLQAIVFLGDLIDRGPESAGVVHALRELEVSLPGKVHCLRGNHEQMLLSCLESSDHLKEWLHLGGLETLDSFRVLKPCDIPADVIAWVRRLPTQWEDRLRCYVHAGLQPGLRLRSQKDQHRLWIREPFLSSGFDFGKHVVHGHSPVEPRRGSRPFPDIRQFRTNVDTGAVYTGVLSAALFDDNQSRPIGVLQAVEGRGVEWRPGPFEVGREQGTRRRELVAASLVFAGLVTAAGAALLGQPGSTRETTLPATGIQLANDVPASEGLGAAEPQEAAGKPEVRSAPGPSPSKEAATPAGLPPKVASATDPLAEALLPWHVSGDRTAASVSRPLGAPVDPPASPSEPAALPDARSKRPIPSGPPDDTLGREPTFATVRPATAPSLPPAEQVVDATGSVKSSEGGQDSVSAVPVSHDPPELQVRDTGADRRQHETFAALTVSPPEPTGADQQRTGQPVMDSLARTGPDAVLAQINGLVNLVPPVDGVSGRQPADTSASREPLTPEGSPGRDLALASADPEPGEHSAVPEIAARLLETIPPAEGVAALDPVPAAPGVQAPGALTGTAQQDDRGSEARDLAVSLALGRLVDLVPPVEEPRGLAPDPLVKAKPATREASASYTSPDVLPPTSLVPPKPGVAKAKAPRAGTRVASRASRAASLDRGFIAALSRLFRADSAGRRTTASRHGDCV